MSKPTNKNNLESPNRKRTDHVSLKPRFEGPVTGVVAPEIATAAAEPASANSTLSFHPLAEIFPVLDDDRLQALANDVAARGLLDEIVLYEGKILDGRCRYLACNRVGVTPKFQNYFGDDPLGFVIGRNVHRRHLTKAQRVFAAARAANLPIGSNKMTPGLPIGRAAKIFEVSERNIARAKAILRHGTADLVRAVESEKVAVSRATKLCELAEEKQIAAVKQITERKRNPRKKKQPAGDLNENSTVGQIAGASPPEFSPGVDRNDSRDAELLDRPDAVVAPENEAAFTSLMAAWSHASNSVRIKFIEVLMRESQLQPGAGQ